MKNLRDYTYSELLELVKGLGEKPYRAEQLFGWLYKKNAPDIDSMTDISKAFRERLKGEFAINALKVVEVKESIDGTRKFLSELEDGSRIESVIIPETGRITLCVSSQAGCALNCRFCMTGTMGLTRNLTLSELTGQVSTALGLLKEGEQLTNIVLMGMGEPLNNYENVLKFIEILIDGKGYGFSHNKVTLSTAGVIPMIKRLASDTNINLAVSLNATTDEVRTRLMPINKKYPLDELIDTLRHYPLRGRKSITIEYVLIKNVNDTPYDAKRLIKLLKGINCKINLIPFNPFPGSALQRPDKEAIDLFFKLLWESDYTVIIRESKGQDIDAACGQLKGWYDEADGHQSP